MREAQNLIVESGFTCDDDKEVLPDLLARSNLSSWLCPDEGAGPPFP